MTKPTATSVEIWIGLSRAYRAALSSIETSLKNAGLPPLPWYDVLWELERAGKNGARAFELRDRLLLPQYGLSRLLDRLEKAGYLERISCDDDGRGHWLIITQKGVAARKDIWLIYGGAIEKALGGKLAPADRQLLPELLRGLQ